MLIQQLRNLVERASRKPSTLEQEAIGLRANITYYEAKLRAMRDASRNACCAGCMFGALWREHYDSLKRRLERLNHVERKFFYSRGLYGPVQEWTSEEL